jgi:two-component system LytT family response regulator
MLRVLIIDDESDIRHTLSDMIARHCPQISLVGTVTCMEDGVNAIRTMQPDLVFLNIGRKNQTKINLLCAVRTIEFKVIAISAFDKARIQALKLSGIEYLLKPIDPTVLESAVRRIQATSINN